VHRWAPYVQGFSARFVQSVLDKFSRDYQKPRIVDPFAGCGTVLVQSKLNNFESYGVELNPLLKFISEVKLNSWIVRPTRLLALYERMPRNALAPEPAFLKCERQFNPGVLLNLKRLKGGIESLHPRTAEDRLIKSLFQVAFAAILVDCSNLKRTPCLGYWAGKQVEDDAPFTLFEKKVHEIAEDLSFLREHHWAAIPAKAQVVCDNSMSHQYETTFDLAITSPPYMSGMDYVMNYKIEMAWLGFITSHKEAKGIKDSMVVCDNVSKGLVKNFALSKSFYTNDWLERINESIQNNLEARGRYRRSDMCWIVQKYFDDMSKVILRVASALNSGGRFILVVGDSLVADTYVPTDLLLARIGTEAGLSVETIELARTRRSGQIRDYRLRETIITLKKP
jgi:hypothetical protein